MCSQPDLNTRLKNEIREKMEETRRYTLELVDIVDDNDFRRQLHKEFSPIGWHLGHIGNFEAFWILQRCKKEPSLSQYYDFFFSPVENPKPNREKLPEREEILEYLERVRKRVFQYLSQIDFYEDHPLLQGARVFKTIIQHEYQHNETIILLLQMLDVEKKRKPFIYDLRSSREKSDRVKIEKASHIEISEPKAPDGMVLIPGGTFLMGSFDEAESLDNERPQHSLYLKDYYIDIYPVTNGEFLKFIVEGGYEEKSLWTEEGWEWKTRNRIRTPLYWREKGKGRWVKKDLFKISKIEPDHPVVHISWYEADAYAKFVGKRLPTEEEWEKAASWNPELKKKNVYPWGDNEPESGRCNFNLQNGGTTSVYRYPDGKSFYGCFDMTGNVWEWTSSWFKPYDGFRAYPYEGYSVPYFDNQHKVLRGGSFATRGTILRSTLRNWYHPYYREIFVGFRCCKDIS